MASLSRLITPLPLLGGMQVNAIAPAQRPSLTLAWADQRERNRVVALASAAGRQTMNLRTMPGAVLVVLRGSDGGLAGWAGMDVESDTEHPEVFSQFVYPEFRGAGLGSLLEHVWWAYLAVQGCAVGFMRMELDSNGALFEHRLASGYCRQVSAQELGPRFVQACRNCELFRGACGRQVYLAVDVRKALAASIALRGPLDLGALPLTVASGPATEAPQRASLRMAM